MKRVINNYKGSTMVLLVVAIGVISLLGTSILGVTMMNFKIKKANTEIKQSFYISEAGLDLAYSNAYELVQKSVEHANEDSQKFTDELDAELLSRLIEYSINNPIDPEFLKYKNYLLFNGSVAESYDEGKIVEGAKSLFENKYREYILKGIDKEDVHIAGIKNLLENSDVENKFEVDVISERYTEGSYEKSGEPETITEWENYTVEISSTSELEYQKKTIVDIVITVPTYNESYTVKTDVIKKDRKWMNVLTAKNIDIKGVSGMDLSLNGNVYSYNSLELNGNNINSTFNGDLIVRGGEDTDTAIKGIILKGNGSSLSIKNVYTRNIILNGSGTSFYSIPHMNSEIYVKDDLEMNSTKQYVDIKGSYYGFASGDASGSANRLNSAIIINSEDIGTVGGSELKISDELLLMGVSYIKNTPYATGESLSIKGNYFVYSMPLSSGTSKIGGQAYSLKWEDIDTVYYMPLPPLVNEFAPESGSTVPMKVWNKGDYFKEYKDKIETGLVLGGSSIQLNTGNITSSGVTISNGNVREAKEPTGSILNRQSEIENKYEEATINMMVDVEDLYKNEVTGTEIVYIGTDNIAITDGKWNVGEYSVNSKIIDRGLIVTSGTIDIYGKFNFTGAILCGDELTFHNDGENKTIYHNETILGAIISKYNLDESIFPGDSESETMRITTYSSGNSSENVDFSKLLRFENWKMN